MYKTKLEDDVDGGEETNIDVHASGGEVHRITLDYGISKYVLSISIYFSKRYSACKKFRFVFTILLTY